MKPASRPTATAELRVRAAEPVPTVRPLNYGYGDCVDCGCDALAHVEGDCPHECEGTNGYA